MAKYTIELHTLLQDEKFKVFDFDYSFYNNDLKEGFEKQFINHYLFHEIGFETVTKFKHYLKSRLNDIMPYYIQLYDTEVKAKDINFLLNKDLKETFTREITGNDTSATTLSSESENHNSSSTTASSTSSSKESYLDNGNADINLTDSLTGVNGNNSTGETSSSNNTTDTTSSTSNTSNANNMSETTELLSQGNIGITSSAELLEKWRNTIININMLIIDECYDLFINVY